MGDNVVVEKLQVEVEAKTETAVKGIDALAASFDRIKGSLKGINFNPISKQLGTLNTALGSMSVANAATLEKFGSAIQTLNGVGSIKLSPTIATQIRGIGEAVRSLVGVDYAPINALVTGLAPLSNLGKNNLTSFITQLSKIPQMMAGIDALDMGKLTSQIQALSNAFAPLATQMQRISAGFAAFPARIQRLINSTNRLSGANKKASLSYVNLTAKLWLAVNAVKAVSRVISSWITRSNKYIEDMNLFTASMGQYADDAQRYAEKVGEIMGIDPGEWMRNQGLFMTLATGFGVVSDRAEIMSRNLTQLGYDISSFFNMSFADAMAKLQSGLAGELEPLRRIGYDLSVARLQEEAYRLGINKRVQAMTQAEKAELRYYAIMTQVTTAQGDMARTLEAPSNQLRILKAQVEQAARALGNIFIPALNAILPYAIALAKVIRLIANEIATLAEFSLPEVDYSGLEAISGGGVEDTLGEAAEKAKELKNNLLGIDELNIISKDDASAGSGLGDTGLGGLGFELPQYDFFKDIEEKTKGIVDRLKEWLGLTEPINSWGEFFETRLGRILKLIGIIGAGILAWKLSTALFSGIEKFLTLLKNPVLSNPLMITAGLILAFTGFAIEWEGIKDALQHGLDKLSFAEIVLGGISGVTGVALIAKGITGLLTSAGLIKAATAGLITLGATGVAGLVASLPALYVGIRDALMNGLDWLNGSLIALSATGTGASIGAIIGALGGPIGAGIGALIGLAVGLLTDLGIIIYENWDAIWAWCVAQWGDVTGFFTSTIPGWWNGTVTPFFSGIGAWFGEVFGSIGTFFKNAWNGIIDFFQSVPGKISAVVKSIGDWFSELSGKIGYGLGYALGSIIKWAGDVWNTVSTEVPKIVSSVINWFAELPGKVWTAISTTASKVLTWGTQVFTAFKEKVTQIITNVGNWFAELPGKIYTAVSGAVAKIGTWASEIIAKAKQVIPEVIGNIVEFFKGIPGKLYELGKDIWQGLIDGLTAAWNAIVTAVKDFVDGFVQGFKDALGIKSPSTVFMEIGGFIVDGFLAGIETFTKIANTVKEWASGVVEWFTKGADGKNIIDHFKDTANNIITGFKDKVGSTYTTVKNNVVTWATNVKAWFENSSFGGVNGTTFSTFANNTIEGFKTKIGSAYTNTKSKIVTWATNVKEWFTNSSFGGVNSTNFSTFANNTIEGFKTKIGSAYTNTQSVITTWASKVKEWFTGSSFGGVNSTNFSTFANNVIDGFKSKIGSAYTTTQSNITTWATNVKTWFSNIASSSAFSGFASDVVNGFKNSIGSNYTSAKSNIETWASSVKSWFSNTVTYTSFYNIAKDVVNGFTGGIVDFVKGSIDTVKNWASSLITAIKTLLGIKSPSRVFNDLAFFTIQGFNNGIMDYGQSTRDLLVKWGESLASVSPDMVLSVDASALKYYDSEAFVKSINANVTSTSSYAVDYSGDMETAMKKAMREVFAENGMAENMQRQADKQEKTILNVDGRKLGETVEDYGRRNGFRFVTT